MGVLGSADVSGVKGRRCWPAQLKVYVDDGRISKFALLRVTELVGNKKLGTASAGKK